MALCESDALAIHAAIHGGKDSVTLASGKTLPVFKNKSKCKAVKTPLGITAMEQNMSKTSEWAKKAKAGCKITWFLGKSPWGRVVDGKVESAGGAIGGCGAASPKKTAQTGKGLAGSVTVSGGTNDLLAKKRPAAALEAGEAPPAKLPKVHGHPVPAAPSAEDVHGLSAIFSGQGCGNEWEKILRPVIESLPNASQYIGPSRDKRIVPVRELTFQALKPNPPSGWKVVSLGQSPYPRIESATGIAHFDNCLSSWEDKAFSRIMTMRCMIKAAAMHKFGVSKDISTQELRNLLKTKGCVQPAEWFQAMLTQGVLFMNAACTLLPPEGPGIRASSVVEEHLKFWRPVIEAVVCAILDDCRRTGRGVVFAWWGAECLKTKKVLQKCFSSYGDVKVQHLEHKNPAAMGDAFCDEPNVFQSINAALTKFGFDAIDWLPDVGWKASILGMKPSKAAKMLADKMGDFITETQDLHKMYLERLRDGLDDRSDDLPDITGIMKVKLLSLKDACKPLELEVPASASVSKAVSMPRGKLTTEEAGALHFYTTNHLYKKLNGALRCPDRKQVHAFFAYLRLLLSALRKMPVSTHMLYRGVALDLSSQYQVGSEVTWWAVSSCTPDLKVANSFSGGSKQTLFIIQPRTSVGIRDFSEFKSEEEFVLAPGTQFRVEKTEKKKNLTEIYLHELDRPCRVR
eukprot:TRINITY_DN35039_c0_g2_i1.p1 TRINITY_DN35039_c0_g2~~TRINITY_DN35039_c0_g2_i1.p1  ORF type:complete len:710 (+),score=116.68 TRINITY_DN35039_c0_g2_i1:76-2130(+)